MPNILGNGIRHTGLDLVFPAMKGDPRAGDRASPSQAQDNGEGVIPDLTGYPGSGIRHTGLDPVYSGQAQDDFTT